MNATLQDDLGPWTTRISVRVSSAEAQEISERAKAASLSVSAYLRAQALSSAAAGNDQEAIAVFDQIIDDFTTRIDQANASLEAALARLTP
jgi:hypothetical protein